jgi:hypothetical protein
MQQQRDRPHDDQCGDDDDDVEHRGGVLAAGRGVKPSAQVHQRHHRSHADTDQQQPDAGAHADQNAIGGQR